MRRYEKGARFERDVVTSFWSHGWAAVRAAGSGTVSFPVPDVIAVKNKDVILVECKTTAKDRLSVKKAVLELNKFAERAGTKAYMAIKFPRQKARFYDIKNLMKRGNFTVSLTDRYVDIEALTGKQKLFA